MSEIAKRVDDLIALGAAADWEQVMRSEVIEEVKDCLIRRKMQMQAAYGGLADESSLKQQECLNMGHRGKQIWFDYLAKKLARKKELDELNIHIELALIQAKRVRSERGVSTNSEAKELREALKKITVAVMEHKESMGWSSNQATIADKALWSVLDRTYMPLGRVGPYLVRDWINTMNGDRT